MPEQPEQQPDEAPRTFTQDQVNSILAEEKRKHAERYADYPDLKAKAERLTALEASQQTAEQRLEAEKATLAEKANGLEAQVARLNAVIAHSLTAEDAAALEGIPADKVDALAARLAAKATEAAKPTPPPRRPARSGTATGDEPNAGKEGAAAALRSLRPGR